MPVACNILPAIVFETLEDQMVDTFLFIPMTLVGYLSHSLLSISNTRAEFFHRQTYISPFCVGAIFVL